MTDSIDEMRSIEPITGSERVVFLDVLRGAAIFGMFTVNMTADLPWGSMFREQPLGVADRAVMMLIDLLANGKFVTIFSFMFGLGFFLQLERARNRGVAFLGIYMRRLTALFLIATVANVAGLGAEILIDYALFGLFLMLFYRLSARSLLIAAVMIFALSFVSTNFEAVSNLINTAESAQAALMDESSGAEVSAEDVGKLIYANGSFMEIASYNASKLAAYLRSWAKPPWGFSILGLMLLGGYVCRSGAIHDPVVRLKIARSVLPWLLGIGAPAMIVFVYLDPWPSADTELLSLIGDVAFWPFGAPVLGLAYVAIITLAMEKDVYRRLLMPFAAVGRMALTNYLFHGFVIAFFTFQWGLGLYGDMGAFWGLMAMLAIFPFMVIASRWWIKRYRYGPMEWLWRTLTYGRIQSMRISKD